MPATSRGAPVSRGPVLTEDDFWLMRLFVLVQAAKGPVSEESIIQELNRRKLGVATPLVIRKLLRYLASRKLIRRIKADGAIFEPTSRGRKALRKWARDSPFAADFSPLADRAADLKISV